MIMTFEKNHLIVSSKRTQEKRKVTKRNGERRESRKKGEKVVDRRVRRDGRGRSGDKRWGTYRRRARGKLNDLKTRGEKIQRQYLGLAGRGKTRTRRGGKRRMRKKKAWPTEGKLGGKGGKAKPRFGK